MKTLRLKRALALLVASLVLAIGVTFAWFEWVNDHPIGIETGTFDVSIDILIDDVPLTGLESYYDPTLSLLELNAFTPASANYIDRLKVVMTVTAHNAARIRFRVQDEWRLTRHFTSGESTTIVLSYDTLTEGIKTYPFNVNGQFFTTGADPYFYYDGLVEAGDTISLTLIDGGTPYAVRTTLNYYEEVFVRFQVFLDVVQANRIAAVWNVDADLFD